MEQMTVKDLKALILGISEAAAQEILPSIPDKNLNQECVMNT